LRSWKTFYPDAEPGGQLSAAQFQYPAMELAVREAIDKTGEQSTEKFPTLSAAKLKDLAFWRFGMGFSILDLLPKSHSLSSSEQLQVSLHLLIRFAEEYCGRLWSSGLLHFLEILRRLQQYSPSLSINSPPFLDIIHKKLVSVANTFNVDTLTAQCPNGTPVESFLLQHLGEAYVISTLDQNVRFILDSRPSSSTAGGGGGESFQVGNKRPRELGAPEKTAKGKIFSAWLSSSPLPQCNVCWNHVLQRDPCANSLTCQSQKKRNHAYPSGTTQKEKSAFLAWLKKKPESS